MIHIETYPRTVLRTKIVSEEMSKQINVTEKDTSEKLMVAQVIVVFPTFYGTRMFITTFTGSRHWTLFRAS
jgi:hypothetical protein